MPVGKSNRVVIDLDVELKQRLYKALAHKGLSLKDWFKEAAIALVAAEKASNGSDHPPAPATATKAADADEGLSEDELAAMFED